jgi:vacuolar-type H+-ATPase subunit F/Vma7
MIQRINAIIDILNGKDIKRNREISPYFDAPNYLPIHPSNEYAGPKIMRDIRYLILLYASKNIDAIFVKSKVRNRFTPRELEKAANFFYTPIKFRRADAIEVYGKWHKLGYVIITNHTKMEITEKGEEYVQKLLDQLILSLPLEKQQGLSLITSPEKSAYVKASNESGYEVSYVIIDVDHANMYNTIQKIAIGLNVQLTEDNQEVPYIMFDNFDNIRQVQNLFLYGRSGIGKSRTLLEIVSSDLANYKKIYLINPNKASEENVYRDDIVQLVSKFNNDVAIIWDNFPLDLIQRSRDSARRVLETVSLTQGKRVVISLSPIYPEAYQKVPLEIPEMHRHGIMYTKENIRNIIKIYGTDIESFTELFRKYVEEDLDNISTILWNKEPTPLVVLEYYKQLSNRIR